MTPNASAVRNTTFFGWPAILVGTEFEICSSAYAARVFSVFSSLSRSSLPRAFTITFSSAPSGACCVAGGGCTPRTLADCAAIGDFQGEGTTCGAVDCTPDQDVVTWVNGTGGDFDVAGNWDTASVPGEAQTARFFLPGIYTVTGGDRRVRRVTVTNGTVNFQGGPLQLLDISLATPSVALAEGRLNVLAGAVVLFVIGLGVRFINPSNWGGDWSGFAPHGFGGIGAAAAYIFFAYIGFDAVSTAAQETKNPQRDLPIGIISSLAICTLLYIGVAAVLTGLVPWKEINIEAPVARAFLDRGMPVASQIRRARLRPMPKMAVSPISAC